MKTLFDELAQQPEALCDLAKEYASNPHRLDLVHLEQPARHLWLTGMGASYHAASIAALLLNHLGLPASAVEAADLLHYGPGPAGEDAVIYVSQSGESGEVGPLLHKLGPGARLVAVTNQPDSLLARRAQVVLPLFAGTEELIASKTYLNSLAILWLLSRRLAGAWGGTEFEQLERAAGSIEDLLAGSQLDVLHSLAAEVEHRPLVFLGHGPHALTARQSAMIVSEWSKTPSLYASIASFRHGFIEAAGPGSVAVVFASPGRTQASAFALASEMEGYGSRVVLVENGRLRLPQETLAPGPPVEEWLSPMLDIIPLELFAGTLAERKGLDQGFRYIQKVVKKL